MKAVVFVFRPMIKEFLNVWTFNLCSATTWTYPFAKHRLTKSSWNVVYLWINQIWQSRLTLQIHFSITSDWYFLQKASYKILTALLTIGSHIVLRCHMEIWAIFQVLCFTVTHPRCRNTAMSVYLEGGSPSRDSLSIILSQCLSPRDWTCCTVCFSALVQC